MSYQEEMGFAFQRTLSLLWHIRDVWVFLFHDLLMLFVCHIENSVTPISNAQLLQKDSILNETANSFKFGPSTPHHQKHTNLYMVFTEIPFER